MNARRWLTGLLYFVGVMELLALPFVFIPWDWMARLLAESDLGVMPEGVIVSYLARSLSAYYAMNGAWVLFLVRDLERYREAIRFWAILTLLMGAVLLGVDLAIGMPLKWTVKEGPFLIAVGIAVLVLAGWVDVGKR